jgi:hypothetical protein
MKTVVHKAKGRGHANHGWLNSWHSFSFASYHNPARMNFGALRVLNDDTVAAGQGFGTHPHKNMEIISIPLEGDLKHMDSMGNVAVIREGDIQVLSAGTGISHSEYNRNQDQEVKFLQIWIIPKEKDVSPRYDQTSIRELAIKNEFYQILSPDADDQGVWIHQDAWFHMGELERGQKTTYRLKKEANGLYLFVLQGQVFVNGHILDQRDALEIWETSELEVTSNGESKVLLMEVPMEY